MAFTIFNLKNSNNVAIAFSKFFKSKALVRWNSKYFQTIPIFYVNAKPHIGHLYTALIGDATARFLKLKNPNLKCRYMVGTDEHGLKVEQSARNNKVNVEDLCNEISGRYKLLFGTFNIDADDFVRTTEERHLKTVVAFWNKIYQKDLIYKDNYSGWYCISDELFVPESFLDPNVGENGIRFTSEGHKPVEFMEEINYKFKLSRFQKDLLYWLKNEDVIRPKIFHEELYKWIVERESLSDISISRPADRISWGIPVPNDPSQTIYVWLDALCSYLCSSGYPDSCFKWPPDLQIIGKDILKFHGVFWPAFLMAADLEPPKRIFCHSHWVKDGEKMSKSKGNVVDPFEQCNKYTSDGFRYFLLREGVPHNNGNFTEVKVTDILNSELADSLGNLLNRCTSTAVNPQQIIPKFSEEEFDKYGKDSAKKLIEALKELPDIVNGHFEEYNFYKGIDAIIGVVHLTNAFLQEVKVWEVSKKPENKKQLNCILHITMESLRVCGILLQPIIPNIAGTLLDKISVDKSRRTFNDIRPFSWEVKNSKETNLIANKVILFNKIRNVQ